MTRLAAFFFGGNGYELEEGIDGDRVASPGRCFRGRPRGRGPVIGGDPAPPALLRFNTPEVLEGADRAVAGILAGDSVTLL